MSKRKIYPECLHCQVHSKSVFCGLNEEDLMQLNADKSCAFFKKGQMIFNQGGFSHGLFCVNNGKIKILQTGNEGKEQIVRLAKEGDIIGYRALLSGEKYSSSAIAIEDSSICCISKDTFFNLIAKNANLSMAIMKLLAHDLKNAEHKITDIAQKPVRERMAEALLFLRETYGCEKDHATINVSLSREEIANMVGTARETASRLLSELKDSGIIDLDTKKIKILNYQGLVRIANIFD